MKRTERPRDTVTMAGWLFADLLLGIAMLFFVFNTVGEVPVTPTATPTPSPTLTPTPSPTTTATPTKTVVPSSTTRPTLAPTATRTLTPSPTNTPLPKGGLNSIPTEIEFKASVDDLLGRDGQKKAQEQARIRSILTEKLGGFGELRAGMVLCFGSTLSSELSLGTRLSDEVNKLLPQALPQAFGDFTVFKAYLSVAGSQSEVGRVTCEVYWILE